MNAPKDSNWPILPRQGIIDSIVDDLRETHTLGVILSGESGSGKTVLAQAVARQLTGEEFIRLRGSELTSAVPYGLLYSLLQEADANTFSNAGAVFRILNSAVTARSGSRRATILIDNAHLVDELSAHALGQLASVGKITLIVVTTDLSELPEGFLELWRDELLTSVLIPPFTVNEMAELLELRLGGPIVAPTLKVFAESSGGNPLYLQYLVIEQLENHSLTRQEGMWVLSGRATISSERLLGLLRTRLDRWTPAQREVLEIVALTESIPFSKLEQIADTGQIEELLDDGVMEIFPDPEPTVRIRHRLVSEVVRASVPFVRRRLLRDRVSPYYADLTSGSAESVLAFSAWTMECGVALEPEIAVRAASLANRLYDPEFALRVATTVTAGPYALAAALQKSRAWRILGLRANAAEILARFDAEKRAKLPLADLVAYAVELATIAGLLPDETDRAIEAIAQARSALGSDKAKAGEGVRRALERRIELAEWDLMIARGRYLEALAPLELAHGTPYADDPNYAVGVASMLAETLATVGRQQDAMRIAHELDAPLRDPELTDDIRDAGYAALFVTFLKCGLWSQNIENLTTGTHSRFGQHLYYGSASDSAAGVSYLFGGRAREGHAFLLSALGQVRVRDVYNSRGEILSALAYSSALLNDTEHTRDYLDELGDGVQSFSHTMASADYLALNARLLLGGDAEVTKRMLAAADDYRTRGLLMDELLLVSAAARLGSAEALKRLHGKRMAQPGPLAAAIYDWAEAIRTDDAELLMSTAEELNQLGNVLFAREAANRVLELATGELATRAGRIVRGANEAIGDAASSDTIPTAFDLLTKRERDVAALAASGLANREIAAQLHLSVRTVESYLQSAFGKLGIGGRTELATALP